jgi:TonB family protein
MTGAAAPDKKGAEQKILRACVVQGGKVIEEMRLRDRGPLSIGYAGGNTFCIADTTLPKAHELFAVKSGGYELVLTEGMRGKISQDGDQSPVDLTSLRSNGAGKKKGDFYHLPLSQDHRGKIVIGDLTLIFQFVSPPPRPPKPELPAEAKGNLLQKIDWPFTICLAVMMVLELSTIVAFQYVPQPKVMPNSLENIGARWAKLIAPEFKPEPEKPKEPPKEVLKAESDAPKELDEDPEEETPKAKEVKAKAKAAKSKKIREKIAGKGILALIGTRGAGGGAGVVADVFSEGSVIGADLDSAFEGIAGVELATEGGARTQRGGGSGEAASIADLKTSGGAGGKVAASKRERAIGKVKSGGIEDLDGELDASKIARVIRRKQRAVQDCYERELKRDPDVAGKIEIEITIGESGRVESAEVISNSTGSPAIGTCAVSRIKRWRFPKPDGGSVTFMAPFTFVAS